MESMAAEALAETEAVIDGYRAKVEAEAAAKEGEAVAAMAEVLATGREEALAQLRQEFQLRTEQRLEEIKQVRCHTVGVKL